MRLATQSRWSSRSAGQRSQWILRLSEYTLVLTSVRVLRCLYQLNYRLTIHKRHVENHSIRDPLVNRIVSAEERYGELFNRHGAFPMLTIFMQNLQSAIEHRNKHESTLTYTDPKQLHRSITASSCSIGYSYGRLHVRSQRITSPTSRKSGVSRYRPYIRLI